jgi:hypothetical protein
MSIDRSPSSTQTTTQDISRDKSDTRPREPAPREKVDDFQRLLQGKRESREPRLQGQTGDDSQPLQQAARREGQETPKWQQDEGAIAGRQEAGEHYEDDALRRQRDDTGGTSLQQQTLDPAALYQAQMAMRDGLPQATAPTPLNPNAFADMVERHLKQMAADRGAAGDGDGRVLLRMADATLPGTDLLLSRTPEGWMLRADVRSRSSFDAIREAAPELARRFAERNLGTLSIDPHFHG